MLQQARVTNIEVLSYGNPQESESSKRKRMVELIFEKNYLANIYKINIYESNLV